VVSQPLLEHVRAGLARRNRSALAHDAPTQKLCVVWNEAEWFLEGG
jgi:hypothetical protein